MQCKRRRKRSSEFHVCNFALHVYTFYLFVYTSTCYMGAYFWVKIRTRVACNTCFAVGLSAGDHRGKISTIARRRGVSLGRAGRAGRRASPARRRRRDGRTGDERIGDNHPDIPPNPPTPQPHTPPSTILSRKLGGIDSDSKGRMIYGILTGGEVADPVVSGPQAS